MDLGFKFEIGDLVTHRAGTLIREQDKEYHVDNQGYFIVHRVLDECPGGIQRHYDCRIITRTSYRGEYATFDKLYRFNEVELIPYKKND